METIWKFTIPVQNGTYVIPTKVRVKRFLHVAAIPGDHRNVNLWALVDTERSVQGEYKVDIYGTGHPLPDYSDFGYFGTVPTDSGLVWHVFLNCDVE